MTSNDIISPTFLLLDYVRPFGQPGPVFIKCKFENGVKVTFESHTLFFDSENRLPLFDENNKPLNEHPSPGEFYQVAINERTNKVHAIKKVKDYEHQN